ncbi:MAG: transposase family protein [Dehalococcoidia bacterium]
MRVRQESKHEIAARWRARYCAASRVEKGRLLDEFVELTGYHRKYAVYLLRHGPTAAAPHAASGRPGGRPERYGPAVIAALTVVAEATGWICGKRLAPFLAEVVPALEHEGALRLAADVREALIQLSAATIDRRLAAARAAAGVPRGRTTTKPGSLLKSQIPIRTYTAWDDQRPGFMEIDLVAHCGTTTAGSYACTLHAVDVATGWSECVAIINKSQAAVFAALQRLRDRLPFPLLGIDSDNGAEFLNDELVRYCQREGLTFTRCRAYHKNDQAHVEQKNWSVVRHLIGYDRYEGEAAVAQLNRIYLVLWVYVNAYQPVMKLIAKERLGARVHKHYDDPLTPYRRAEAAQVLLDEGRTRFAAVRDAHGPLALRRLLDRELERLWRLRVDGAPARPAAIGAAAE